MKSKYYFGNKKMKIILSLLALILILSCFQPTPVVAVTYTVTNNNDAGTGSLRQAILDANSSPGADTITIADGIGIITLGSALPVTGDLTITGPASGVEINVNGIHRHLSSSTSNITLTLENLTFTGRKTSATDTTVGGGVQVTGPSSTLVMEDCAVKNCYRSNSGGGGINANSVDLTDCIITGNTTDDFFYGGGGIYASTAILNNCDISDNSAPGSIADGGGIHVSNTADFTNCVISDNTAVYGAGIYVGTGVSVGSATLLNCQITGNEADTRGGGVYVAIQATLENCTVSNNIAGTDSNAGVYGGNVTLTNSTISNNEAGGHSGGVDANIATITNCTIVDNSCGTYGGGLTATYTADIFGSIVAGNTAAQNGNNVYINTGSVSWPDAAPTSTNNYSIIGYESPITQATVFGGTPVLGANGGPTDTILINPNGSARDIIPNATSWVPDKDQRGISRPQGSASDIGAVELEGSSATTHKITYRDYDYGYKGKTGNLKNLPTSYNNAMTYTEGVGLTLPTVAPYNLPGYEFLGWWDCPLDPNIKDTNYSSSNNSKNPNLDFTIGNKIEKIPANATKDIVLYARYSSPIVKASTKESKDNPKKYLNAPKGVFPAGAKAVLRTVKPGTAEYKKISAQIDDKSKSNRTDIIVYDMVDKNGKRIQPLSFFGTVLIGFVVPKDLDISTLTVVEVKGGSDKNCDKFTFRDPNTNRLYTEMLIGHSMPYTFAMLDLPSGVKPEFGSGNTGDMSNVFIPISVLIAALITMYLVYRRKKQS